MNTVFQIESEEVFFIQINELISSLYTNHIFGPEYDSDVAKQAKLECQQLLVSNDFDLYNISEDIKDKHWDEMKVKYFLKLLSVKKSSLVLAALQDHNSTYGQVITDFNWKIKLILGTSQLKTLKYPILQLLFSVYSKSIHKKINCEVTPNVLSKLINELENLNIAD